MRSTALADAVAGLADAEQLFAVRVGGFDRPAVGVALHDVLEVASVSVVNRARS